MSVEIKVLVLLNRPRLSWQTCANIKQNYQWSHDGGQSTQPEASLYALNDPCIKTMTQLQRSISYSNQVASPLTGLLLIPSMQETVFKLCGLASSRDEHIFDSCENPTAVSCQCKKCLDVWQKSATVLTAKRQTILAWTCTFYAQYFLHLFQVINYLSEIFRCRRSRWKVITWADHCFASSTKSCLWGKSVLQRSMMGHWPFESNLAARLTHCFLVPRVPFLTVSWTRIASVLHSFSHSMVSIWVVSN